MKPNDFNKGNKMKKLVTVLLLLAVSGCRTDATVASYNLSRASEQFQVVRRVVFYNGITDTYILTIEGLCSIEHRNAKLEVTCKTGENKYKKHYLGLSDNVTYFLEQLEPKAVSVYHYKVVFKPQVVLPDIELSVGVQ